VIGDGDWQTGACELSLGASEQRHNSSARRLLFINHCNHCFVIAKHGYAFTTPCLPPRNASSHDWVKFEEHKRLGPEGECAKFG
jgi:hypothetical protein